MCEDNMTRAINKDLSLNTYQVEPMATDGSKSISDIVSRLLSPNGNMFQSILNSGNAEASSWLINSAMKFAKTSGVSEAEKRKVGFVNSC